MRRILSILLTITIIMVFTVVVNGKEKEEMHHEGMHYKVMPKAVWHICNCDTCSCNIFSDKPGKCTCGRDLVPVHILKIKGNKGYFCSCGPDCSCKLDSQYPTKCTCGNPIKVVDLTGKYVCECCNVISSTPGRCACGKELEKLKGY